MNVLISSWIDRTIYSMRPCISCGRIHLSASHGNRHCAACIKKESDARSRPYMRKRRLEVELDELIDEMFDPDLLDPVRKSYVREYEEKRRQAREKRVSERKKAKEH